MYKASLARKKDAHAKRASSGKHTPLTTKGSKTRHRYVDSGYNRFGG
jgi:hypothetical protein